MMRITYYFFIVFFISNLPANAQLFGGQIKTKKPLLNQYPTGSVFCNGETAIVDVTNPTTGKTWMDRNLGASRAATSSTDALSYGDLYQWGRRSDGHQCRNSSTTFSLSTTDSPNNGLYILAGGPLNDWRSPQNNNLWQGGNGINNPCPNGYRIPTESELNVERASWSSQNNLGAFGSNIKLPMAGSRRFGDGSIAFVGSGGNYWSSLVSTSQSRFLNFSNSNANMNTNVRAQGLSVRCIKDVMPSQGSIGSLDCINATKAGVLYEGITASDISFSVSYTLGNGGIHNGQTVSSTGVTGLTATVVSGNFANDSGSLTYTITGTPSAIGTASFALDIGGQSCTLTRTVVASNSPQYPVGSVFCASDATAIVDVTNPATGKTWMDRNLGATRAATSSNDAQAYGDLYQWGRRADGHQCRTSPNTTTLSSTDQPGHGNFILAPNSPYDWRSPQNSNLWQGVNGVNNPCPSGYRLPTLTEWETEQTSWSGNNAAGAFASPLKLSMTGRRDSDFGAVLAMEYIGYYWSSSIKGDNFSNYVEIWDGLKAFFGRSTSMSIRCIKE